MSNVRPKAESSFRDGGHDDCLRIEDVAVAYQRKVVLKGVRADVRRGQTVGIIGPNGGGKSTLLKAVLGIAPVVKGTITLFGRPSKEMRSCIAYVPQRELVDWEFPVTVHDVVMMGRYPRTGWPKRQRQEDRQIVERMLERVGMTPFAKRQIGQLSGGQQQRVFIARALAQEADVLLLDEPMNGIDAATQDVILEVMEEQRSAGKIILLATHDLVSASCACDCLCCINEHMVSYGPFQETYTAETLAATYGGPVIMLGRADQQDAIHKHHHHEMGHSRDREDLLSERE